MIHLDIAAAGAIMLEHMGGGANKAQDYWFPVFEKFFTSTIAEEAENVRLVWLGLLCMGSRGRRRGYVTATPEAIQRFVNLRDTPEATGLERCQAALGRLQEADPRSTSPGEDGKRLIEESPNVWRLVNYEYYAEQLTSDFRREQSRRGMQRKRENDAMLADVRNVRNVALRRDEIKQEEKREKRGSAKRNLKGADAPPAISADELADLGKALSIINPKRTSKPSAGEIAAWKQLRQADSVHQLGPYSAVEIHETLEWAMQDDFWSANVQALTPLKQRKPSGDIRKFDKLVKSRHKRQRDEDARMRATLREAGFNPDEE